MFLKFIIGSKRRLALSLVFILICDLPLAVWAMPSGRESGEEGHEEQEPELYTIVSLELQALYSEAWKLDQMRMFLAFLRDHGHVFVGADYRFFWRNNDGEKEFGIEVGKSVVGAALNPSGTPGAEAAQVNRNPFVFMPLSPKREQGSPSSHHNSPASVEVHNLWWLPFVEGKEAYPEEMERSKLPPSFGHIRMSEREEEPTVLSPYRGGEESYYPSDFVQAEGVLPKPSPLSSVQEEDSEESESDRRFMEEEFNAFMTTTLNKGPRYFIKHGKLNPEQLYVVYVIKDDFGGDFEIIVPFDTLKRRQLSDMIAPDSEYPMNNREYAIPSEEDKESVKREKEKKIREALLSLLRNFEATHNPALPEGNMMLNRNFGSGISAQVSNTLYRFRSLAIKRTHVALDTREEAERVIDALGAYVSLCERIVKESLVPVVYLWIYSERLKKYIIYSVQGELQNNQFMGVILASPVVDTETKLKVIDDFYRGISPYNDYDFERIKRNGGRRDGIMTVNTDMNPGNFVYVDGRLKQMDIVPTYTQLNGQMSPVNDLVIDMWPERRRNLYAMSSEPSYPFFFVLVNVLGQMNESRDKVKEMVRVNAYSHVENKLMNDWRQIYDKCVSITCETSWLMKRIRKLKLHSNVKKSSDRQDKSREDKYFDYFLFSLQIGGFKEDESDDIEFQEDEVYQRIQQMDDRTYLEKMLAALVRLENNINSTKEKLKKGGGRFLSKKNKYVSGRMRQFQFVDENERYRYYFKRMFGFKFPGVCADNMCFWQSLLVVLEDICKRSGLSYENLFNGRNARDLMIDVQNLRDRMLQAGEHRTTSRADEPASWFVADDIPVVLRFLYMQTGMRFRILLIHINEEWNPVGVSYQHNEDGQTEIDVIHNISEIARSANMPHTLVFFNHLHGAYTNQQYDHWSPVLSYSNLNLNVASYSFNPFSYPSSATGWESMTAAPPARTSYPEQSSRKKRPSESDSEDLFASVLSSLDQLQPPSKKNKPDKMRKRTFNIDRLGFAHFPKKTKYIHPDNSKGGYYSYSAYLRKALANLMRLIHPEEWSVFANFLNELLPNNFRPHQRYGNSHNILDYEPYFFAFLDWLIRDVEKSTVNKKPNGIVVFQPVAGSDENKPVYNWWVFWRTKNDKGASMHHSRTGSSHDITEFLRNHPSFYALYTTAPALNSEHFVLPFEVSEYTLVPGWWVVIPDEQMHQRWGSGVSRDALAESHDPEQLDSLDMTRLLEGLEFSSGAMVEGDQGVEVLMENLNEYRNDLEVDGEGDDQDDSWDDTDDASDDTGTGRSPFQGKQVTFLRENPLNVTKENTQGCISIVKSYSPLCFEPVPLLAIPAQIMAYFKRNTY